MLGPRMTEIVDVLLHDAGSSAPMRAGDDVAPPPHAVTAAFTASSCAHPPFIYTAPPLSY